MVESDEEMNFTSTPPDIQDAASTATLSLLPEKSRERYLAAYIKFSDWCRLKTVCILTENVVLAYLAEKSKSLAPSTLWSEYSMLKATLVVKENLDISKMSKVIAFLKRKSEGYKPKKAKIFTRSEINKFLEEAPDEVYLMIKVCWWGLFLISLYTYLCRLVGRFNNGHSGRMP